MAKAGPASTVTRRIEIGGKVYIGRMTLDALTKLQEIWNLELDQLQVRLEKPKPADLKDLFYCSLIFDQPQLTREEASRLTNEIGLTDLIGFISGVLTASRPPEGAAASGP